jgi:hypothetical protein
MPSRQLPLLLDANVLLDLCESDRNVLRLVADTIGTVHVPSPILLEELSHLANGVEWAKIGVTAVEPDLEIARRAASRPAGLTFHDHLCLLVAKQRDLRCVTNDGCLSWACASEGVATLSGLDVIAKLVDAGRMALPAAADTGQAMQRANPRFITAAVLEEFRQHIGLRTPGQTDPTTPASRS